MSNKHTTQPGTAKHQHGHNNHLHHEHKDHSHHEHESLSPHSKALQGKPVVQHTKQPATILTVRASSGLSGDMMLAGLASIANISHKDLELLIRELNMPILNDVVKLEAKSINSIAGVGCSISLPQEHTHRGLCDITTIIENSSMPERAKELSIKTFTLLAHAEATVHGKPLDQVHFHEVGALDSILDICMVCRLFTILQPDEFICSPLPMADGSIFCAHGRIPSPAPAVLHMLEGIAVCGFSGQGETVTPTALSLLKALGANFGTWPSMTVQKTVISYGTKVFPHVSNGAIWAIGKA